jgi:hypothetical protein
MQNIGRNIYLVMALILYTVTHGAYIFILQTIRRYLICYTCILLLCILWLLDPNAGTYHTITPTMGYLQITSFELPYHHKTRPSLSVESIVTGKTDVQREESRNCKKPQGLYLYMPNAGGRQQSLLTCGHRLCATPTRSTCMHHKQTGNPHRSTYFQAPRSVGIHFTRTHSVALFMF